MLEEACRQTRQWQEEFGNPSLSVSVNMSARQITGHDLVDEISAVISNEPVLARRASTEKSKEVITNLNARIKAWWLMVAVFAVAVLVGPIGSIVLFTLVSFLALREYFGVSATLHADHRVLLWLVFVVLPANYLLVAVKWYGLFAIFIPVYAFIWLQIRAALSGVTEDFLSRTARIQWGMMVTICFVSYIPALLMLEVPHYRETAQNFKLMLFLVVVVQASDVLQYVVGKLFARTPIAPQLSPNKTVEGFVGGVALATTLGRRWSRQLHSTSGREPAWPCSSA